METRYRFDYLVLGSGIAGLSFALDAARHGPVGIVTKKHRAESNTNYAQGGIAAVTSKEDSIERHVEDTCTSGAGLCQQEVVRTILSEGPARVRELIELGIRFTERQVPNSGGVRELDLGREGGHSKRRVLHVKDTTGRSVEKALLASIASKPNITVLENHLAIDLITTRAAGRDGPNRCYGVRVLNCKTGAVESFLSPVTLLATGGCGKVYLYTTNPDIASGDGVAMAYRAGTRIANMEFIQFHPTCLYHPRAKTFLISEAVRGEGAVLKTLEGKTFMGSYDPRASLAPRDIVARAIDTEMKRSGTQHVVLDITHKPARFIIDRFPNIYLTCLDYGIDITKEPIPVVPAAHYQCGGVLTNVNGETDIAGLYAVGEVGCTGLHGANRLASNSLLEALVVAHRAALRAVTQSASIDGLDLPPAKKTAAKRSEELVVVSHNWQEIRHLMWDYVGIVRSNQRLQRAQRRIRALQTEIQEYYSVSTLIPDLIELRNLCTIAGLIVESALARHESRGLHYNADYPDTAPELAQRDTVVQRDVGARLEKRGAPSQTP